MLSTNAAPPGPRTAQITRASATGSPPTIRPNARKHLSRNRLQRRLIDRFHARVAALLRRFGDHPLVLDLGCGEGFGAQALRSLGAVRTVVGVDADFGALLAARGARSLLPVCGEAGRLPFPAGALPVAVCLEVLEHLERPEAALGELLRVSAGPVVLSVPHQPWFAVANVLRGKNWPTFGDDPDHRHAWRPGSFLALVRRQAAVTAHSFAFPWLIVVARAGDR